MRPTLAVLVLLLPRTAGADDAFAFPVAVSVATEGGRAVVDGEWVAERLGVANRVFGPAGVRFQQGEWRSLPDSFARLDDVRERRALSRHAQPRALHLFVVAWIADPRTGSILGGHIPSPRRTPATYLIVARESLLSTVAHELGHFFGLPHSRRPTSPMSYARGARSDLWLDDRELRAVRSSAARYARTLARVGPGCR